MFKKALICALFIVMMLECSSLKRDYKVYSGDIISSWADNPYRFIVLLYGQATCTGAFFNSKTVLSAGHCFMDPLAVPTHIALECTNRSIKKYVKIEQAFIPTQFQTNYTKGDTNGEDCSVVKLENPINFNNVAHRALTYISSKIITGTTVILVGYGADSGHNDSHGTLRQGRAVVTPCFFSADDKRICVNPSRSFSNQINEQGDSGMPLVIEHGGKYFGYGMLSGNLKFLTGDRESVFASYEKHEQYIKIHAV